MKIALLFLGCIAVLVFLLNRQRASMARLRTRRRFTPDWSRTRGGPIRRHRTRFRTLRAEMDRLEAQRSAVSRGNESPRGNETESDEKASGAGPGDPSSAG